MDFKGFVHIVFTSGIFMMAWNVRQFKVFYFVLSGERTTQKKKQKQNQNKNTKNQSNKHTQKNPNTEKHNKAQQSCFLSGGKKLCLLVVAL